MKKTNTTKAKAAKAAATLKAKRSAAAKKAWQTIRAKKLAASKSKATKSNTYSSDFVALVTSKMPKQEAAKLVKGLIKDTPPTVGEINGNFGVSNINARKLTKAALQPKKVWASLVDLFKTATAWTKYAAAKDSKNQSVDVNSPAAESFCLSGAIARVYPDLHVRRVVQNKLSKVVKAYSLGKHSSLVTFNDTSSTTLEDIRRVVALAEV